MSDFLIYLLILSGSTYLIRAVPFAAVRRSITNKYVKSFLYYIPFAVLTAMTIPSAFYTTGNVASGAVGLFVGGAFAFKGKGLTFVAVASCIGALLTELLIALF